MKKINNKVFIALLSVFILFVGLVAGTSLVKKIQEIREGAAPAPNVVISPQSINVKRGDTFSFSVRSDTGSYQVAGVDLYVTFIPSVFEVTSVIKGSGLSDFSEWVNEVDNVGGLISFTATTQNLTQLVQGSDVELIVVTGKVKSGASLGGYYIGFASGTILVDEEGNDIYATPVPGTINIESGVTITVIPPTSTPTTTPGVTNTPTPSSPPTSPTVTPTLPASSYPDTILRIDPEQTTVGLGTTFAMNLMIESGVNQVVGTQVYLSYNPMVIRATNIVPGTFFQNPVETVKRLDSGLIEYVLHIPPEVSPSRGDAVLANITFEALSEGVTDLTIASNSLVAAINLDGANALKTRYKGTITVRRASLPGDINDMGTYCGDGKVNILDYTILFEHFGEAPSTHPCADINEDGRVNILDYVILFENFGRTL